MKSEDSAFTTLRKYCVVRTSANNFNFKSALKRNVPCLAVKMPFSLSTLLDICITYSAKLTTRIQHPLKNYNIEVLIFYGKIKQMSYLYNK